MRVAFDIGGVLSKFPFVFRKLLEALACGGVEVHVISDMHDVSKMRAMLEANHIRIAPGRIHAADYVTHGDGCKAELCKALGIDVLVDDVIGYVDVPGAPVRLLVMPDASRPYYADEWKTDGSEGDFGRRKYLDKKERGAG